MRKYISIWRTFFSNSLTRDMEFKANFISNIGVDLIYYISLYLFYHVIFQFTDSIGTFDKDVSKEGNADPMKYQSQSLMRYNTLFTQVMEMTVASNTNLKAGDIITCRFPKSNSEDNEEISGLYMIKELCHHFDRIGSWTSMKLVRDTYGLYGTNN